MSKNFKNQSQFVWTKKSKWIVAISIILCLVIGSTICLTSAFRQKVDPNFANSQYVQSVRRAQTYKGIKNQVENYKKTKSNINATVEERAILEKGETEFLNQFYDLLEKNVEFEQLFIFVNDFIYSPNNIELMNTYQNIAERNEQQANARGIKKVGTYAYNDVRGINWLNVEASYWGVLCGCLVALVTIVAITAAIATVLTGGALAWLWTIIVPAATVLLGCTWGIAKEASKALATATSLAERGKGYTVYRLTGFLGITSGYSVEEA